MAGRKRTPGRRCSSAVPSNKLWAPISAGKIPEQSCSPNGLRCQNQGLHYSNGDSWDRMLRQGIMLLTRFCQDDRVQVTQPRRNLQIKFTRPIAGKNDFVAYIDAIGKLDGRRCLLEWKTSSSRYPEEPEGLLSLDPQLVCYSWMTGIAEVAQVVFVRKRLVEVQYLRTTITDEQRAGIRSLGGETRSEESSRRSSCRTAVSAFRRIPAAAVRMWDFVLESRRWLTPAWCGVQEQRVLIGLTSLHY